MQIHERLVDLTDRCVPTPVTLYIRTIEKIGHECLAPRQDEDGILRAVDQLW